MSAWLLLKLNKLDIGKLERSIQMAKLKLPDNLTIYGPNQAELRYLYKEIFKNNIYLEEGIEINEGDCVIDIGANIGMFMRNIHFKCKGKVNIYAFEPIPRTYQALRKNAAIDPDHLHTFNLGISTTEQTATFEFMPQMTLWSTAKQGFCQERYERWQTDIDAVVKPLPRIFRLPVKRFVLWRLKKRINKIQQVKCQLKPLSDIIESENIKRIDLLKIDVEGSEVSVLQGISEENWPIIKQVSMEVESKENLDTVTRILENHNFSIKTKLIKQNLGLDHAELSHLWAIRA